MDQDKSESPSLWSRFLKFIYDNKTELKIIAFITAYHYYQKYYSRFKPSKNDSPQIPESCPGPGTEKAGLSSSCEGCPNRSVCSSNNPAPGNASSEVNNSLKDVSNIIIVASGKGGVGKSTVATQLAFSLEYLGKKVGLLDVDVTGPSIPSMTGTRNEEVFESLLGWTPVYVKNNLSVMSIGYLMSNDESCISWRGAKKDAIIKKFLTNVNWGQLDYLVVDTPPGTSDEHITLVNTIKSSTNSCKSLNVKVILVTTPQKRAIDDVRRSAQFCNDVGFKIIMLVENMTNSFLDSKNSDTSSETHYLKDNSEILKSLCDKYSINKHVMVDSNPCITQAGESGEFLVENSPFTKIANLVLELE